jgi:hypothetical protein
MPPLAPESWTHIYSIDSDSECGTNTSDASGNVMLERRSGPGDISDFETDLWDIFTTVGNARGSMQQFNGAQIFPQEWGFQTLGFERGCSVGQFDCAPPLSLAAWTANGALIERTVPTFDVQASQLDPAGGMVLAGLRPQQPFTIVVEWFDQHSSPLAPQAVVARGTTQPTFIAAGVSVSGLILVLWNGDFSGFPANSIVGRWLDRFGQATTGTFLVARNATMDAGGVAPFDDVALGGVPRRGVTPLIDGSMAIRGFTGFPAAPTRGWITIVGSGSTAVSPVPDWLATRPDARVHIVRGGRAYALVFPIDVTGSVCGPVTVAVFAPAGNRCGGFDLDSGGPGPSCAIVGNIGRDGSLIVTGQTGDSQRNCKYRVFPALLQ